MKQDENKETVLCIYDENGVSINEIILEVFKLYIESNVKK